MNDQAKTITLYSKPPTPKLGFLYAIADIMSRKNMSYLT